MSSSSSSHFLKDRDGRSKFIGGAAMQRRNALKNRSKKATRILRPDQVLKSRETLSWKMSPFERYFAGLLRSEAMEFAPPPLSQQQQQQQQQRNNNNSKDREVWEAICQRLGLPVPSSPLPPTYPTAQAHFGNRAALVMEESRYAIADGLRRLQQRYKESQYRLNLQNNNNKNSSRSNHDRNHQPQPSQPAALFPETAENQRDQSMISMELILKAVEQQNTTGHSVLTFAKERSPLTRLEKQSLRNGTVFACLNRKLVPNMSNVVLAAVLPQNREEMEATNSFAVMVFRTVPKRDTNNNNEQWNLTSITSLLSDQRKYDACMEQMQRPVPFLFALLGGKRANHLRFGDDDEEMTQKEATIKSEPGTDAPHNSQVLPNEEEGSSSDDESISSSSSSSSSDDDDDESTSDSTSTSESSSHSSVEVIEIVDSDDSDVEVLETLDGNASLLINNATSSRQEETAEDLSSDPSKHNGKAEENRASRSKLEPSDAQAESDSEVEVIESFDSNNEVEAVDANVESHRDVEILEGHRLNNGMVTADDSVLRGDIPVVENFVACSGDDVFLEQIDSDNIEAESMVSDDGAVDEVEVLEIVDVESTFHMPLLNPSQQAAAKSFLDSKPREITLIQGPPGTGKTTLLSSVIGQYVLESKKLQHEKRQLMVCAPTNKAVGVVCSRFLDTFINEDSFPCNVVLIGDDDKLFDDDFHLGGSKSSFSKLRSVFLYTFIDTIVGDYVYISRVIKTKGSLNAAIQSKIKKMALRLHNRMYQNFGDKEVISLSRSILSQVDEFCAANSNTVSSMLEDDLFSIRKTLDGWNRESAMKEILRNADIIFGTLASTGAAFLRKSIGQIEDLIVDEAAAATEPEMYIPFAYSPKRLLAVGDPKQLPATVASQVAERLGLDRSLHERLMYDCGFDHVMLDTQYRSKPTIMQFPASHFYGNKLSNGGNVIQMGYNNGLNMISSSPYMMLQVNGVEKQGRSGSYQNFDEATAVVKIIEKFRSSAFKKYGAKWCTSDRLRVITFYQAQVALISQLLRKKGLGNVLVATVDSSQGCEADHVIVSFVRSDGESGRKSVGFLTDNRRLNVALTRARYQLVCVGNIKRLSTLPEGKSDSVRRLAEDAFSRDCVHPFGRERHKFTSKPSEHRKRPSRSQGEAIRKRRQG